MPRPEIIDRLFDARYEYERAIFLTKAQARKRYRDVLLEATAKYRCTEEELLKKLAGRYWEWIRQNKMPPPSQQ